MSTPPGPPPRRRRIAGEAKPGTPVPKAPAPKATRRPLVRTGKSGGASQAAPSAPSAPPKVVTPKQKKQKAAPQPTPEQDSTSPAATTAPVAAPAAAAAEDAPTSRRTWRRRAPLVVVTVAALAFGAVFGVRGFLEWRDTRGIVAAHTAAAESAATAAETIFTYRYDRLDEHLEDSQELMTSSFAKEFETISPALNDLAPQRKIQVQASTRQAAATPCGDDCSPTKATVLVFIDQARVIDDDETPTVFGNRITVSMVERDGDWLVDDVSAL